MHTLLLTQREVRDLLQMEVAVRAMERAFADHGRGEAVMPPKVYIPLAHHHGDFRAMPAYADGSAGVKWVNSHPENPRRHGLPAVRGIYILSDPATANPLAILDATLITACRTGAGAAIASKYLARSAPETLGIVGCGVQSRYLVEAHRQVWSGIEVRTADISRRAAERLAGEIDGQPVSIEEAAACDIVCTATPSRHPLVQREWIRPGIHLNAVGADAPGKQELDPRILLEAEIFLDDLHQASESGEVNVPLSAGILEPDRIRGTLGEVIAGRRKGRSGDDAITVFDSTGLAIQDLALARAVYDAARERGAGREIDIFE